MRRQSFLRIPNIWRVGLILLVIVASLTAGTSSLVWASPLAPLIVGGVVVAAALGIAFLQRPVFALYAAIFLILLPKGLIPRDPKDSLTDLVLLSAVLSWLLNAAFQRRRIVWVSTNLLMGCFLIWSVVTLFWTPRLVVARGALLMFTYGFVLLLLLVNEIDSLQTLDGLMRTLALNGWVLVLAGIGTVLLQGLGSEGRLFVLEADVNAFGVSLIVTMPGVLWQAIRPPKRWRALRMSLSVVFILLATILVALTGSRGSAISLLTTLLVFGFWKPTRLWGKLGLLILVVAAVSAPLLFSTTLDRFVEQDFGTLGGRLVIWQATWPLIRDHPWGGVGIGNAPYEMIPYYRMLTSWRREGGRSIHQPVLAIWAETGTPGILLYLGVLGSAIWLFVRQVRQRSGTGVRPLASYSALMSCVFVGYMLSWIKGGGLETDPRYFLLLALLLIPSRLDIDGVDGMTESDVQDTGRDKL